MQTKILQTHKLSTTGCGLTLLRIIIHITEHSFFQRKILFADKDHGHMHATVAQTAVISRTRCLANHLFNLHHTDQWGGFSYQPTVAAFTDKAKEHNVFLFLTQKCDTDNNLCHIKMYKVEAESSGGE